MKNIVNIENIEWTYEEHGDFARGRKQLGRATGGEMLGTSIFKLSPGKKSFPYHFHYANEEAIYILEGAGNLRLNNEIFPVKKGDYIALPKGLAHAHQMFNSSDKELLYLCISTMVHPEVLEYPDSEKIGVMGGKAPGGKDSSETLVAFYKKEAQVDYFTREK